MNIAVIGSGGREHAIVWKLCQHHPKKSIFFLPGNPGYDNCCDVDIGDFNAIADCCKKQKIELVIVGPEAPLADGLVDALAVHGIRVFGPSQEAAKLESSKIFAKEFMKRYGVATADFWAFSYIDDAFDLIEDLKGRLVLKYDGLAGGKGVTVCNSIPEAQRALEGLRGKYGDKVPFLVEELLNGEEISLIAFTDGKTVRFLRTSQDHKQAYDGDKGPMTGGMGAICPWPGCNHLLREVIESTIINPTLKGLQSEGFDYRGVIYFGLMLTENGPKLLEYNIRLGDPEAEVTLPMLKNDLLEVVSACLDGSLLEVDLEGYQGACADVVLTSKGYPNSYETGFAISGLDLLDPSTLVFHSATAIKDGQLVTSGGRVLNIVCRGENVEEAVAKAYKECAKISFEGITYRKDIGFRCLVTA